MKEWLAPVWLITRRELRDQLRDWRILTPLILLTVLFPILMNHVAKEAVAFVAQYGGTLLVDRLVPFSILIIGFFPITVSLVVSLEAFVGEKERGTIEPLLSTPLQDSHMYVGKLLIGIVTPLTASLVAIGFYLIIVSRQDIAMPDLPVMIQLLGLTIAHAVLMVSAAIVISVQSTSVKAANLLASFIVVPVAILMQGETALLFWGNNQVLWLAVLAVLIVAGLVIRVGLAHFQREYMLGRELDILDLRWIGRTFWQAFKGKANSVRNWYKLEVKRVMFELRLPILVMVVIAVLAIGISFQWSIDQIGNFTNGTQPEKVNEMFSQLQESPVLAGLGENFSAPYIFGHNVRAVFIILLAGLVSFSVLGIFVYLINLGVVGVVLAAFGFMGYSPVNLAFAGLLPHGIFEIPALIIASAAVLRIGAVLVTPQSGRSLGVVILDVLADWLKVTLGIVIPLLAIAAVIEAYLTPVILISMIK